MTQLHEDDALIEAAIAIDLAKLRCIDFGVWGDDGAEKIGRMALVYALLEYALVDAKPREDSVGSWGNFVIDAAKEFAYQNERRSKK